MLPIANVANCQCCQCGNVANCQLRHWRFPPGRVASPRRPPPQRERSAPLGEAASRRFRQRRDRNCWRTGGRRAGERVVIIANLSLPLPVAGTSLEALCHVRSTPLPLVRARGAHCKTAAHRSKAKRRLSTGEKPSGRGAFWQGEGCATGEGPPKAPRQRQSQWIAHASRAKSLAVRAPCAHPRRSIGQALGKALPKTARPQAR